MVSRPLRFCMLTTFYPPYNFGGDGISVYQLCNELAQRGHEVEVIHCVDAYRLLSRRTPSITYDNHPNVTVHSLKSAFGMLSPLVTHQTGYPFFKMAHIRHILERGFDVIHYHNISLLGPKVLEYGQAIKLYTMREYWLVCPTNILFRFNRAPCIQPHCSLCSLAYKRPPQLWRHSSLLKNAVKHVDAFIAPSRFSMEKHLQMGLNVPMIHLPNFVPVASEEAPLTAGQRGLQTADEPFFLFVGRLEKIKGAHTLIPIFQHYRKASLWIAGTGSEELKLRQLARGSDKIRFLDFLSDRQLQPLYRRAVAVIVPSICYEVFGRVIIEALRQRTPVIVNNLGGMPEVVKESGGGFVYNSEEELIAAMDRLLGDTTLRRELGNRGHQVYQQKWTADVHVQGYLGLIRDIAAARGLSLGGGLST